MNDTLVLQILTSPDESDYATLLKATVQELLHSELSAPMTPSPNDVHAALMRIAGNSCDDTLERATAIITSRISLTKFTNAVTKAYAWKVQGLW